MFANVGGKLKGFAVAFCWIRIIASLIGAIALWSVETEQYVGYHHYETIHPYVAQGLGVLVGGFLVSWFGSLGLYALGEITENSNAQVSNLDQMNKLLERVCSETKEETSEKNTDECSNNDRLPLSDNQVEDDE